MLGSTLIPHGGINSEQAGNNNGLIEIQGELRLSTLKYPVSISSFSPHCRSRCPARTAPCYVPVVTCITPAQHAATQKESQSDVGQWDNGGGVPKLSWSWGRKRRAGESVKLAAGGKPGCNSQQRRVWRTQCGVGIYPLLLLPAGPRIS